MIYSKEEIAKKLTDRGLCCLKDFSDFDIGCYKSVLNLSDEDIEHICDILHSLDNRDIPVDYSGYTLDEFVIHAEYIQEVAPELYEKVMVGFASFGITVEHGILTSFWDNDFKRISNLSTGRLNLPTKFLKDELSPNLVYRGHLYINYTENGKELIYNINSDRLSKRACLEDFITYFAIDDSSAEVMRRKPISTIMFKLSYIKDELNFSLLICGEPVITKDTKDVFYNATLLWKIIFSKIVYKITGSSVFEFFDLDTADFFTPLNVDKYKSAAGQELYTLHKYTFIPLDKILRDWWDGVMCCC